MASRGTKMAPENSGKMFQKRSIKRVGQATQKSYLKNRMTADDSKSVCMSDKKLGKGISSE